MIALLGALGVAAVASLWLSDLPMNVRILAGAGAAFYALGLIVREVRREPCVLAWAGGGAPWQISCNESSQSMNHVAASFRGGLVVLTLRDDAAGRNRRFVWWPDTLDAASRRALRLSSAAARGPGAGCSNG